MTERIGFGNRFGAALIDFIAVIIGGGAFGMLFGGLLGGGVGASTGGGEGAAAGGAFGAILGAGLGMAVVGFLYGLIEAITAQSPGKMILGIQIGNDDGTLADINTLFVRYGVKNIGALCSILAMITGIQIISTLGSLGGLIVFVGFFMVLGAKRQAIHDLVAKTAVYWKKDLTSGTPASETTPEIEG